MITKPCLFSYFEPEELLFCCQDYFFKKTDLRLSYHTFRTRNGRGNLHAWKRKTHVKEFGRRDCMKNNTVKNWI
jgi:hypothetical protein